MHFTINSARMGSRIPLGSLGLSSFLPSPFLLLSNRRNRKRKETKMTLKLGNPSRIISKCSRKQNTEFGNPLHTVCFTGVSRPSLENVIGAVPYTYVKESCLTYTVSFLKSKNTVLPGIAKIVPWWNPEMWKLHLAALIKDVNFAPRLQMCECWTW